MKHFLAMLQFILLSGTCLYAQQVSDTMKTFGLSRLIESAATTNSKLGPIEIQRKIELVKREQFNKQPMPMFEAMIDYVPLDFMEKPEYSAFYSQKLVAPGKLDAAEQISAVSYEKQSILKDQLRLELERQVKDNYFSIHYLQELIRFNSEYQAITRNIISSLELLYSSGMGSQNQILRMNNELQMLGLELIELETAKQVKVNNLRTFTNIELPDDFEVDKMSFIQYPLSVADSSYLAQTMIENNPEFRMIDNMIDAARVEKNIAELENVPDITLRGGFRYMAREPMTYMNFGIGVDLPFLPWNKNRINAMIEEKTAMELQANAVRSSTVQYMKSELQSMILMLSSSGRKLEYLDEILIPQTEQTFSSILASYSAGSSEFMNLLDAYRKLREMSQMRAKEETELLKQIGELEFLIGKQILTSK